LWWNCYVNVDSFKFRFTGKNKKDYMIWIVRLTLKTPTVLLLIVKIHLETGLQIIS